MIPAGILFAGGRCYLQWSFLQCRSLPIPSYNSNAVLYKRKSGVDTAARPPLSSTVIAGELIKLIYCFTIMVRDHPGDKVDYMCGI